ncbi:MAG TPA: carboxypeptidase-like regulatory domain-containing protein [Bacteroidetes bacterium]|nr:carboxypeptidase-like regulatory domain-containing protein [Bacteroidota bacterium]
MFHQLLAMNHRQSSLLQHLFLGLFSLIITTGQAQIILHGRITEAGTGEPLSFVNISLQGSKQGVISKENGQYQLEIPSRDATLQLSRLGYKTQILPVHAKTPGFRLDITMKVSDITLENVVISDGLQSVLSDKSLYLYDYEFFEEQLFVILYDRKSHRTQLALIDARDSIIDITNGLEKPGKLIKDCLGNVHVIGKQYACQLFIVAEQIAMYKDNLSDFKRIVEPCLGKLDEYYYYKFSFGNDQILEYIAFNAQEKTQKPLLQIKDQKKIHQMLDPMGPYSQFASTEAQLMHISTATWKKINTLNHDYQFNRRVFFYPISAPIHTIKSQVYLFDHTNGIIYQLDKDGTPQAEIPISYHKSSRFQRSVITDPIREEAYAIYEQHGYLTLKEIDLKTGKTIANYEVPRRFPRKIQVRDGVLFFMYKESNYDTCNRLYRLRIKQ